MFNPEFQVRTRKWRLLTLANRVVRLLRGSPAYAPKVSERWSLTQNCVGISLETQVRPGCHVAYLMMTDDAASDREDSDKESTEEEELMLAKLLLLLLLLAALKDPAISSSSEELSSKEPSTNLAMDLRFP